MKINELTVYDVVGTVIDNPKIKSATKYLSNKKVIRATRRTYKLGRRHYTDPLEILVSVCKPNYRERQFIKMCKQARVAFPVRNIQLRWIANAN